MYFYIARLIRLDFWIGAWYYVSIQKERNVIMKKSISFILTAFILLTVIPMSFFRVSAERYEDDLGYEYLLSDDETYYTLIGYYGSESVLTLPAAANGLPVRATGTNFSSYNRTITSVTIPDSIVIIGDYSFNSCTNLTELILPDTMLSIGDYAFVESSIKSITLGKSLQFIGENTFECSTLESITVSEENKVFKSVDNCLIEIATNTLIRGTINSIIPDDGSVATIGQRAFATSALTSISIPDAVTTIQTKAFFKCVNLISVKLHDNLTLGNSAFEQCFSLGSIELPSTLTEISEGLLNNCESLTEINIPSTVETIGGGAFSYCRSITEISVPESVKSIGVSAFANCENLSKITLPDGVEYIGDSAFAYCLKLSSFTMPKSTTIVSAGLMDRCASLTEFVFHNNVTQISQGAFYACTSLETLNIPSSVTYIAMDSFCETGIKHIEFPDSVERFDDIIFNNCPDLEYVKLPSTLKTISGWMFYNCPKLTPVEIPASVTRIKYYAFEQCNSIDVMYIPATVEFIEENGIYRCDGLTDVYCEATEKPEGWSDTWINLCPNATVHWGCTIEDALDTLSSEIEKNESELNESDYAQPEWESIQIAIEDAKEVSDDLNYVEIMSKIDVLERAILLNPKKSEFGDLDGDAKIGASDYLFTKRACFNTYALDEVQIVRADIDRNGSVNSSDYVAIKRISFGTFVIG